MFTEIFTFTSLKKWNEKKNHYNIKIYEKKIQPERDYETIINL